MKRLCSPAYGITVRLGMSDEPGVFAGATEAVGDAGGDVGDVAIIDETRGYVVRDIEIGARDVRLRTLLFLFA